MFVKHQEFPAHKDLSKIWKGTGRYARSVFERVLGPIRRREWCVFMFSTNLDRTAEVKR